jgi:hypothetical protein
MKKDILEQNVGTVPNPVWFKLFPISSHHMYSALLSALKQLSTQQLPPLLSGGHKCEVVGTLDVRSRYTRG